MLSGTPQPRRALSLLTLALAASAMPATALAVTPSPTPTGSPTPEPTGTPTPSVSASATPTSASTPTVSSAPAVTSSSTAAPGASRTAVASPAPTTASATPSSPTPTPAASSATQTVSAAASQPTLLTAPAQVPVCQPVPLSGQASAGTVVQVERLSGSTWTSVGQATATTAGTWTLSDRADACYPGATTYRARTSLATSAAVSVTHTGSVPSYTLAASQATHSSGGTYRNWGAVTVQGSISVPTATTLTIWTVSPDMTRVARLTTVNTDARGAFRTTIAFPAGTGYLFVDSGRGARTQRSSLVAVPSGTARLTMSTAPSIDATATGYVSGTLTPVPTGSLRVLVQVYHNGSWTQVVQGGITGGSYRLPYTPFLFKDVPGTYQVRAAVVQPDGTKLWSPSGVVHRTANLSATVRATTSADVARSYRAGCPVGPSGLRTIDMNFIGYDGAVHRGQMIVRRDLSSRVVAAFDQGLKGGFPIKSMNNPNVYGGDDVTMMRAGNTSAFNCRHVTGNPYAMSPHSYGKAIDVNTIENPYEDPNGRWYPSTAYSVSRPASVKGLLTSSSALTVGLKAQGYAWFSGWDWQHFEAK